MPVMSDARGQHQLRVDDRDDDLVVDHLLAELGVGLRLGVARRRQRLCQQLGSFGLSIGLPADPPPALAAQDEFGIKPKYWTYWLVSVWSGAK